MSESKTQPSELVDQLKRIALFEGVASQELSQLAKMAQESNLVKGEPMVEEGALGSDVWAILQGRVEIRVAMPNGSLSEAIATLKEDEILGESILLGRSRRIATAIAKDDVRAVKWTTTQLNEFFQENPQAGFLVMRNLARIIHERLTATNMMLRNTFNQVIGLMN
jgi:CRP/FNR family transcriptional regulator, cyclic AMP receptor protein